MYVDPLERATWYAWNSARLALGVIVAALMSAVSDAAGSRASVAVMSRSGATPRRSVEGGMAYSRLRKARATAIGRCSRRPWIWTGNPDLADRFRWWHEV